MTDPSSSEKIIKTDKQWQEILTPEQYRIARERGTERAFTGKFLHNKENGAYQCAVCGNPLFHSDTKFDSGTGWPSFWSPINEDVVGTESDVSFFMKRTEVVCNRCGAHLGHVFEDGPKPTGLRYCINSTVLTFKKEEPDPKK